MTAYAFSAKGAAFHRQPVASPQEFKSSSKQALKARFNSPVMTRAFSAAVLGTMNPWGDAPGYDETAPLAPNRDMTAEA